MGNHHRIEAGFIGICGKITGSDHHLGDIGRATHKRYHAFNDAFLGVIRAEGAVELDVLRINIRLPVTVVFPAQDPLVIGEIVHFDMDLC